MSTTTTKMVDEDSLPLQTYTRRVVLDLVQTRLKNSLRAHNISLAKPGIGSTEFLNWNKVVTKPEAVSFIFNDHMMGDINYPVSFLTSNYTTGKGVNTTHGRALEFNAMTTDVEKERLSIEGYIDAIVMYVSQKIIARQCSIEPEQTITFYSTSIRAAQYQPTPSECLTNVAVHYVVLVT